MEQKYESAIPFMKMHGLGNDFVVLDARIKPFRMTSALAVALADRHMGVGFDQQTRNIGGFLSEIIEKDFLNPLKPC